MSNLKLPLICTVESCDRRGHAKLMCEKHYRQVRDHGRILTKEDISEIYRQANYKRPKQFGWKWSAEAKEKSSTKSRGIRKNTGRTHFKKGHKSWTTGLKDWMSPQHKEALRIASSSRRGKDSPTWKGGKSSERHRAMGRLEYKIWRTAVFERDNYTCQICDQYGGTLHADHIKEWSKYPELRYNTDNGRTLCIPCHYYITYKRKMPIGAIWCNYRMIGKRG